MDLGESSYDILVERGLLAKAEKHLNLDRRVLVVTDTGVPAIYAQTIADQCATPVVCTIEMGEASKSLEVFGRLLQTMLEHGFSRKDCVVAVGGGVVGDLAGFVASAYMRGIDFYNIPTTLLSQIDSSIGGKTAINLGGVKNIVGAFYQPKKVLIDPNLLQTLPARQISNGLAEAIKMALTSDAELFEIFEKKEIESYIDDIIIRSLYIKKSVVEQDEKEAGLRKILNFGHTIGHGIESSENLSELYHGECVALGLIPMCDKKIRQRVIAVLKKCGLYNRIDFDWEKIAEATFHDKKADGDQVTVVLVPEIGTFELKKMKCTEVMELAERCFEEEAPGIWRYGCIGKKLGHSFSKEIHEKLADYAYELIELTEEEIVTFFEKKEFAAVNVTIPYKQTVIPYLDVVSEMATRIGAVNTIVNKNGKLYGYNTDFSGLAALITRNGIELKGKKVLILGSGGTSKTALAVAESMGCGWVRRVSREGREDCITYEEAATLHADTEIIINTTPVGMYPQIDAAPIDLADYPQVEAVVDVVYNPLQTKLVQEAHQKGITAVSGLYMLVAQAALAVEKFLDISVPESEIDRVYEELVSKKAAGK